MTYRESRNRRAFASAQAAWDNAVPDDYWDDDPEEEATPYCPNCGCDMEWLDAEWRCEACEDGGEVDENAEYDKHTHPACPSCGSDSRWKMYDDVWVCDCQDEPAEPGESHKEMGERK